MSKMRMAKPKTGIRRKVTSFIFLATSLIMLVGLSLGFFYGSGLVRDIIGKGNVKAAENIAISIDMLLERQIQNIRIYFAENPLHRDAILESGALYKGRTAAEIKEHMLEMDNKWAAAGADSPLVSEHLDNKSAEQLSYFVSTGTAISEIFTTDRFGGLVAASGKTEDFYQADEEWWQKAYNGGKGATYMGSVGYDESAAVKAVTVALPVKDEKDRVIGVCKAVLNIDVLFVIIRDFTIGRTGHACLVDDSGRVIYHSGDEYLNEKICSYEDFKKLVNDPENWEILRRPLVHERKDLFLAFAAVESPVLRENGVTWRIFVVQRSDETFAPIRDLFKVMALIMAVLFLVALPIIFFLGEAFARPIRELYKATERISEGELDCPINIRTGDEIEQLAVSFKKMIAIIKTRENDLKELAGSLEKKVKEKTRDLGRAQEATLHILEDLQVSKEELEKKTEKLNASLEESERSREAMVSMLSDNNQIREELEKKLEELKKAQVMLAESEKLALVGKLVSDMAHEVNNPLMVVAGRAQLALMEDIKSEPVKEDLRIINDQCMRAKDIIQRLLTFSKPSKGEVKEVDVNRTINLVIQLIKHQYQLADIKVIERFSKKMPAVEADAKQLQEVLMNLLKNSAEAMPEGGTITVRTSAPSADKVEIDIEDTGEGIPEENLAKIFDPFFTTKKTGTGLGLPVCHGIIREHGGKMEYTSVPGKGTKVTITLPAGKEA